MPQICSELSVITAAYNAEPYLAQTIQSVAAQNLLPRDYIIVNDGSTDRTGEVAESFAQRHPWISVLHTPNQGISKARNQAWRASQGSLIAHIDADDYYAPDALATLYQGWQQALPSHPHLALVYGNYLRFYDISVKDPSKASEQGAQLVSPPPPKPRGPELLRQIFVMNMALPSTCLYSRAVLEQMGGWRESSEGQYTPQDQELMIRLASRFEIVKLEHLIVHYRQHGQQENSNQGRLRYFHDAVRLEFLHKQGPEALFPEAHEPEEMARWLEALALSLIRRKSKKPVDTVLLLLQIAQALAPTAQRQANIQAFQADIPVIMEKLYPGGERVPVASDPALLAERCRQALF